MTRKRRTYRPNKWAWADLFMTCNKLFLAGKERERRIQLHEARLKAEAARLEAVRIRNARAELERELAETKIALANSQVALIELEIEKRRKGLGLDSEFDAQNYE